MARERMITRTVSRTKVRVLGLNLNTAQAEEREFEFSGGYEDEKTALKAILTPVYYTPVKVLEHETQDLLYGMSEDEFIAHARVLPPRKVYDTAE